MKKIGKQWYFNDVSSGLPTDGNYAAVLSRADALAYTRPTAQEVHQNILSTAFTNGGVYSTHDVIHIFAVNNVAVSNFSHLNWKSPTTFQTAVVSSPTYGVSGWNSGAGAGSLNHGFNPTSSGITWIDASTCSVSFWISQYPSNVSDYGGTSAATRNIFGRQSATQTYAALHQSPENASYTTGAQAAYDLITISQYGGNRYLFKNGSQIATSSVTFATSGSQPFRYMQSINLGAPTNLILGGAFIGGAVTLEIHTSMYNALTTYRTSIGL